MAFGAFFFCIFADYGIGFYVGSVITEKKYINHNFDRLYNVADITTIFFAVITGAFATGNAAPAAKSITKAREAAFNIYKIIDRVSPIVLDDKTKKVAD
jgi:hypothetical protein